MDRNGFATLATAFVGCAALLFSTPALSQQMWTDGSPSSISENDLVPKLSSAEAYIERYNFNAQLDSGGKVNVDFVISNMGWGDLNGAVKIKLKFPNHENYKFRKKLSQDKWSSADDELRLSIADTTLTRPESGKFVIEHEGGTPFRVVFENRLSSWQPGDGRLKAGKSYYIAHLLAPRARVEGTAKIGGKDVEFSSESHGFGEHTATNVAPYNTAKRFSWFRTYNDNVTVIWKYIDLTEKFGGGEVAWIMVGYNRRIVFSNADAAVKFARTRPDGPSGYQVPRAVQIEAKSGEDHVKFAHKGTSYKRNNLMDNYGTIAKSVASSVTNPYRFRIPGEYSFQMTIQGATAKIDGDDNFTIDILNE